MELQDFEFKINRVDDLLIADRPDWFYRYVCNSIKLTFNETIHHDFDRPVLNSFIKIFQQEDKCYGEPYFGEGSIRNMNKRRIALRIFERICIEEKLYEEF